ncbi:unnamed protein product, partial [Rotaria magnacalcarata]
VGAVNDMKVLDEKEFQSLRLQLLDLQSKTDDKSEIGKLKFLLSGIHQVIN